MKAPIKKSDHKIIEIVSLVMLVSAFYPLLFWNQLVDDVLIPIHYNAYGYADGWGKKEYLLLLPLFSVITYMILFFSNRKNTFIISQQIRDRDELYRLHVQLLRQMDYIKLIVMCMFSYLSNISFYFASKKITDPRINPFIMIAFIIALFVFVIRYCIKSNCLQIRGYKSSYQD